jgi:FkbM family methyltransferase
VYDIGAFRGEWTRRGSQIFPTANFFLFEANQDNEAHLQQGRGKYFLTALAAKDDDERAFYTSRNAVGTGASLYRENTDAYADENLVVRKVRTMRLDSLVASNKLKHADLIKIDVQGAELDVLAGAAEAIKHCEVLIVEMSLLNYNRAAPLFGDVVSAINLLGFKCVDICEVHRIGPDLIFQMDLMFVRPALYEKYYSASGLV